MNSVQHVLDPLSGPVKPRNRRRNPLWRFRRFFFVLVLLVVVGAGTVLYIFSQTTLPEDEYGELAQTSFLCTAEVTENCGPENATAMFSTGGEDREILTYEELPQQLIDAVVATEDQDYFEHQGIDPRGISRAAYQYVQNTYFDANGSLQGGSTITQQYVKLAFSDSEDNLMRKMREAVRAIKLEQELAEECVAGPDIGDKDPALCAKEELLARYLNRAYFGRGASGVAAAARSYFGADVEELTIAESAFLAGLLRNPNGADPANPDKPEQKEEADRRREIGIGLMLEAGFITPAEAQAANEEPWNAEPRQNREGLGEVKGAAYGTEYFVEEVRQEIEQLYPDGEIYTGGFRVYTTLDPRLQRAAYAAAHEPKDENLEEREDPELGQAWLDPNDPDDPSAALVSLDGEGRVVAMLGGTNFEEDEFNLATSRGSVGRQPGSTFKALALATAIEQGISAKSLYPAIPGVTRVDAPCLDESGQPWQVTGGADSRDRYRDLVEALTWSSNVVFAQLVVDIGPDQLRDMAYKMGITADLTNNGFTPCSLVLGGKEVSVLDMTTAFSVFERGGTKLDPVLIERIEDVDGNVVCTYPIDGVCAEDSGDQNRLGEQVLTPTASRQTAYVMTQVAQNGTGQDAIWSEEIPVAGKTGTSQEHRDGWFAGFTCDLTTVVWMGYESNKTMTDFRMEQEDGTIGAALQEDGITPVDTGHPNVSGGNMPTWIWRDYMREATKGAPPCEGLEVDSELTGTVLNSELAVTTLPPCGIVLDDYGFPRGHSPDQWEYVTTTVPDESPPNGGDGDQGDQPEGLPVQNPPGGGDGDGDDDDQGGEPRDPCVPPEVWEVQRDWDGDVPTFQSGDPGGGPDTTQPGGDGGDDDGNGGGDDNNGDDNNGGDNGGGNSDGDDSGNGNRGRGGDNDESPITPFPPPPTSDTEPDQEQPDDGGLDGFGGAGTSEDAG